MAECKRSSAYIPLRAFPLRLKIMFDARTRKEMNRWDWRKRNQSKKKPTVPKSRSDAEKLCLLC